MPRNEHRKPVKASVFLEKMQEDIKSLNASVLIITQKMKYVVRNEKILGRNLIVLNKKLRSLEERIATGEVGLAVPGEAVGSQQLQQLENKIEGSNRRIAGLQAALRSLQETAATKEELLEMHYVVDSINPLQFVTLDQLKDMLQRKPAKKSKRGKKKKKGK